MSNIKRALAFDFGASSGRAIVGSFDGNTIKLEEVHRFENIPVKLGDTLYWDLPRLFHEVKQGLVKAHNSGGFDTAAVDTWGVDFALIGSDGHILECPVHYRDERTSGMFDYAFMRLNKEQFYKITGNQFMEINTAFQLISLVKNRPHILKNASSLIMMPNLFNYLLTGKVQTELSIASTTQLLNMVNKKWSKTVVNALGIPERLLPEIVPAGTSAGLISEDICKELGISPAEIISVCGHDTQCAAAAAPTSEKDFIFISCGTWSLFGTETNEPVINDKSASLNITNELGYEGKTTFLKNIIGLWLIQESRRQFKREGKDYSYAELERLALQSEPFKCFINPDAPEFVPVGNIPERIREFCRKTNQYIPETEGEIIRCIYESLALKYRQTFDEICECTGKNYNGIYLVGGGVKDGLLCRMTASACNCKLYAGPIEATAYGNIAIQFIAKCVIPDIKTARQIIAASDTIKTFEPENTDIWQTAYDKFITYQN